MAEEYLGEFTPPDLLEHLRGEDDEYDKPTTSSSTLSFDAPTAERKLTFEEASRCLNTLGKDESGARYAYLKITATDRMLMDVSVVLNFKHVMFLDLSGNLLDLEALQVVTKMPFLLFLKAERNRLVSAALQEASYLQVLNLNRNKILETNDIRQPMLEWLNLEFNAISIAQFDTEKLPCLKELDMKGNELRDVSESYPESVERLFLGQNKITSLQGLVDSKFKNLTTLHLRDNKIRKLDGFTEILHNLTYLNLRNNRVTKLRQFRKLNCLANLETLIVSGNPVEGVSELGGEDEHHALGEDFPTQSDEVRIGMLVLLPKLVRINKVKVTPTERDEAWLVKDEKLVSIMDESSSEDENEPPTTTAEYISDADESYDNVDRRDIEEYLLNG